MINEQVPQQAGVFNTIKSKIQLDTWAEKIRASKGTFIDIAVYTGIGFLFGFLLKKYSRYVIGLLVVIGALFVLHQGGVITLKVHTAKVHELLGLQPVVTGETPGTILWEWVKANVIVTISFAIGFLLGLRVG